MTISKITNTDDYITWLNSYNDIIKEIKITFKNYDDLLIQLSTLNTSLNIDNNDQLSSIDKQIDEIEKKYNALLLNDLNALYTQLLNDITSIELLSINLLDTDITTLQAQIKALETIIQQLLARLKDVDDARFKNIENNILSILDKILKLQNRITVNNTRIDILEYKPTKEILVSTLIAKNKQTDSIQLNGFLTSLGEETSVLCYFVYREYRSNTDFIETPHQKITKQSLFTETIENLDFSKTYEVYAIAKSETDIKKHDKGFVYFISSLSDPQITINDATEILTDSFIANGSFVKFNTFNKDSTFAHFEYRYELDTTFTPTEELKVIYTGLVSSSIKNLKKNSKYYIKLVVIDKENNNKVETGLKTIITFGTGLDTDSIIDISDSNLTATTLPSIQNGYIKLSKLYTNESENCTAISDSVQQNVSDPYWKQLVLKYRYNLPNTFKFTQSVTEKNVLLIDDPTSILKSNDRIFLDNNGVPDYATINKIQKVQGSSIISARLFNNRDVLNSIIPYCNDILCFSSDSNNYTLITDENKIYLYKFFAGFYALEQTIELGINCEKLEIKDIGTSKYLIISGRASANNYFYVWTGVKFMFEQTVDTTHSTLNNAYCIIKTGTITNSYMLNMIYCDMYDTWDSVNYYFDWDICNITNNSLNHSQLRVPVPLILTDVSNNTFTYNLGKFENAQYATINNDTVSYIAVANTRDRILIFKFDGSTVSYFNKIELGFVPRQIRSISLSGVNYLAVLSPSSLNLYKQINSAFKLYSTTNLNDFNNDCVCFNTKLINNQLTLIVGANDKLAYYIFDTEFFILKQTISTNPNEINTFTDNQYKCGYKSIDFITVDNVEHLSISRYELHGNNLSSLYINILLSDFYYDGNDYVFKENPQNKVQLNKNINYKPLLLAKAPNITYYYSMNETNTQRNYIEFIPKETNINSNIITSTSEKIDTLGREISLKIDFDDSAVVEQLYAEMYI